MDFKNVKKQVLNARDLSKKGSVDKAIHELVLYLNKFDNYVTTSSCSGRAILMSVSHSPTKKAKSNCEWLFATHDKFEAEEIISKIDPSNGDLLFKFEPFILHVMCADLKSATTLLKVAIGTGFRESGITIGSHGKTMVAIRSNIRLEVPISEDAIMLVSDAYFFTLTRKANEKFDDNFKKLKMFFKILQETLDAKFPPNNKTESEAECEDTKG